MGKTNCCCCTHLMRNNLTMLNSTKHKTRIPAVDFARGIALVAMAVFHFGWDLENFGLARPGMTVEPLWKYFARSIASSFLVLIGISSWMAHSNGFNLKSFTKRIAMVGGAAAVISIATWFATPEGFIFFGILHNIALSSLLILAFMRLRVIILLPAALFTLTARFWATTPLLDDPWWWWTGLSQIIPKANDYVPMFPWFGWVILGLAIAKIFDQTNTWQAIGKWQFSGSTGQLMQFFGRHSLVFYLAHQPILIGLVYIYVKFIAGT